MRYVEAVVMAVLDTGARSATKFISPKLIMRATRRIFADLPKTLPTREDADLVITIGRPNYLERKFVKDCQRAGVTFPVRKIQLKFPPKSRKKS